MMAARSEKEAIHRASPNLFSGSSWWQIRTLLGWEPDSRSSFDKLHHDHGIFDFDIELGMIHLFRCHRLPSCRPAGPTKCTSLTRGRSRAGLQ